MCKTPPQTSLKLQPPHPSEEGIGGVGVVRVEEAGEEENLHQLKLRQLRRLQHHQQQLPRTRALVMPQQRVIVKNYAKSISNGVRMDLTVLHRGSAL